MAAETFPQPRNDHVLTVAAIGVLAFIATDVAHEVVGHGIGLFLAGGRGGLFTTTKLISETTRPEPFWRIFDLGGPVGNLIWTAMCLALLRKARHAPTHGRLFL
ncbi:MAG: hypothetical protein M3Z64_04465 [Verrucomicrobiota bacterium]|nr:hypothetical protein [Verrucomicrobiota bacterium]